MVLGLFPKYSTVAFKNNPYIGTSFKYSVNPLLLSHNTHYLPRNNGNLGFFRHNKRHNVYKFNYPHYLMINNINSINKNYLKHSPYVGTKLCNTFDILYTNNKNILPKHNGLLGFFKHNTYTPYRENITQNKSQSGTIPESVYVIIGKYLMQQQNQTHNPSS